MIKYLFSDQNGIELKTSNTKIVIKFQNTWRLNNTFLNNIWSKKKSQKKSKII